MELRIKTLGVFAGWILSVAIAGAQDSPDELTKAEWKCEQAASRAAFTFFRDALDCGGDCAEAAEIDVTRSCLALNPDVTTQLCLNRKRAKAEIKILRACTGEPCPECYFGGNCRSFSFSRLRSAEFGGMSTASQLYCDDRASPDGWNPAEKRCQHKMIKATGALADSIRACASRCRKRRGGTVDDPSCRTANLGTADVNARFQSCVDRARRKFLRTCPACFDPPECWAVDSIQCSGAVRLAETWAFPSEAQLFCVDQPICGDGRVSPSEACDVSAFPAGCGPGEFCASDCASCEPVPDVCGEATAVPPQGGIFNGFLSGPSTTTSFCGGAGPERAYVWVPDRSGTATIETCGSPPDTFDSIVSIRTTCDSIGSEFACNDDACGLRSRITPRVEAGLPYYIFVDALSGFESGPFELQIMGTSQ